MILLDLSLMTLQQNINRYSFQQLPRENLAIQRIDRNRLPVVFSGQALEVLPPLRDGDPPPVGPGALVQGGRGPPAHGRSAHRPAHSLVQVVEGAAVVGEGGPEGRGRQSASGHAHRRVCKGTQCDMR